MHFSSIPRVLYDIFLDLITVVTFREEYKLWSSSLCRLLQLPLKSTYSPQHPLLIYLQSVFFS